MSASEMCYGCKKALTGTVPFSAFGIKPLCGDCFTKCDAEMRDAMAVVYDKWLNKAPTPAPDGKAEDHPA